MNPAKPPKLTELKWRLVGVLGKWIVDAIFAFASVRIDGDKAVKSILDSRRFILAFWHSRILLLSYLHKGWDGLILVSQSDDGEIIARIVARQGHEPIRGSSSRGGLRALAGLIKKLKERPRPAVIIPDGPRGPRFKVQPGIITLAKKTGYPILPVSYSAKTAKIFNSWDRFMVPLPGTACQIRYGVPLWVPPDADGPETQNRRKALETELCRITQIVDAAFGRELES